MGPTPRSPDFSDLCADGTGDLASLSNQGTRKATSRPKKMSMPKVKTFSQSEIRFGDVGRLACWVVVGAVGCWAKRHLHEISAFSHFEHSQKLTKIIKNH